MKPKATVDSLRLDLNNCRDVVFGINRDNEFYIKTWCGDAEDFERDEMEAIRDTIDRILELANPTKKK